MSNVILFPLRPRAPVQRIPREEFERLAELALDVVDRLMALLERDEVETAPGPVSFRGGPPRIVVATGGDLRLEMPEGPS